MLLILTFLLGTTFFSVSFRFSLLRGDSFTSFSFFSFFFSSELCRRFFGATKIPAGMRVGGGGVEVVVVVVVVVVIVADSVEINAVTPSFSLSAEADGKPASSLGMIGP